MLVANRFEIEREAGSGGMSRVFAARDRLDGARVALKLIQRQTANDIERFLREARVLSELRHPSIVRYVAHGVTASGEPYLAMQWLDGHDLEIHLQRGRLSPSQAVGVLARVADALAVSHAHGVIHRDVKPSNVFLERGDLERPMLIDFGIARLAGLPRGATRTGTTVGTPGYMSPEQARGEPLDARADVYSLGCVLYECLTGKPVFQGDHAIALLAKILMAPAPRVSDALKDVPPELDTLVARMIGKDPSERPADAAAVARALAGLSGLPSFVPAPASQGKIRALTASEQRIVCAVLASVPRVASMGETLTPEQISSAPFSARAAAARHGCEVHVLADGSMVVTPAAGTASDQAWQAARAAIALRDVSPELSISIATARGERTAERPALEVLDHAARLLSAEGRSEVHLDEATAALLGDRFELAETERGTVLVAEHVVADKVPTLLGRPTLCVGRERELATLLGVYEECVEEKVARAAIVVAPAGTGKSRVRYELLRRMAQRGAPEPWMARGDPMSAGSPLGMLGQALRRAVGIREGEPIEARRARLEDRALKHVPARERKRVAQFLGELVGAPFPDDENLALKEARRDAMLMNEQVSRAFLDFVESECRAHPVVLVFEDLHWGDAPTVHLVDAALAHVRGHSLFVLAIARPELRGLFPRLWTERGVLELNLTELGRAASEKLVRSALGKSATPAEVARIVERAGGNAFYLEELVRAVVEGSGDALPGTVLAMAESRLHRLDGEARRLLRAASVLGTVFWRGGVLALLGGEGQTALVDQSLEMLVHREVIARRSESKLPGETEYVFRHTLLRDASYAMLTEEDRALGHQLAAEWLEIQGRSESLVLAEHFERGRLGARAAGWYAKAAASALESYDLGGAIEAGKRGLACGASGHDRATILLLQSEAELLLGDNAEALRCALAATDTFGRHTGPWYGALGVAVQASSRLSQSGTMQATVDLLREPSDKRVSAEQAAACGFAGQAYNHVGDYARCAELLGWVESQADAVVLAEPAVAIGLGIARASLAVSIGELDGYRRHREQVAEVAERIGKVGEAIASRARVGYAWFLVGLYDEAERRLRASAQAAADLGLRSAASFAKHNLGLALERLGRLEEARTLETQALEEYRAQGDLRYQAASQYYLATILLRGGDLEGAEREARMACDSCRSLPPSHAESLATLARVLLAREGKGAEALAVARHAMEILEKLGSLDEGEAMVRLVHAQALEASGLTDEARGAIAGACRSLHARAERIVDGEWRRSYLERVLENKETFALASAWGVHV